MSFGRAYVRVVVFLCAALAVISGTFDKTTAQNPLLTVRVDKPLGQISPFVYGVNDGPWSMVAPDMIPMAQAAGVTYLRFPAGDWGDLNDLTPFHIDLFMTFAHQLHAEPSISARLKGGTSEAAAALVKYVNIEKKYGVRYWSVGNEPNLYRNYSVEQYNRDWRKIAEAMLAVDPTIIFVGPDTSQFPPSQMVDADSNTYRDWVRSFLKANGDLIGIVSVHRYPFPKSMDTVPTTISELKDSAREWDDIIPTLRKIVTETVGHDLPIAITEVNSHWNNTSGGEATPDSFYHAVWWADALGRMIRQRVEIVAYFTLNTSGNIGTFGLLSRYDVRPTYYVYQLYHQFGTELLETQSSDPDVTITAALRRDGTLTLMIVNPTLQPKSVTLALSGFAVAGPVGLWLLDPDHKAEHIGTTTDLNMLNLPPQSVSLYIASPNPETK